MDLFLFQQVNQFFLKCFWLDSLAIIIAEYLGYALLLFLVLFLIVNFRKYLKMVIQAVVSAVLARFVIVEFIRLLWQRPRPFLEYDTPAFPSGHAALFFAISTIVYFYNKKAGILFFIASFLICLARIFIGLHWPTDILAGAAIGILSAWLIHKIKLRS